MSALIFSKRLAVDIAIEKKQRDVRTAMMRNQITAKPKTCAKAVTAPPALSSRELQYITEGRHYKVARSYKNQRSGLDNT